LRFNSYCYLAPANAGEVSTEKPIKLFSIISCILRSVNFFTGTINCKSLDSFIFITVHVILLAMEENGS